MNPVQNSHHGYTSNWTHLQRNKFLRIARVPHMQYQGLGNHGGRGSIAPPGFDKTFFIKSTCINNPPSPGFLDLPTTLSISLTELRTHCKMDCTFCCTSSTQKTHFDFSKSGVYSSRSMVVVMVCMAVCRGITGDFFSRTKNLKGNLTKKSFFMSFSSHARQIQSFKY